VFSRSNSSGSKGKKTPPDVQNELVDFDSLGCNFFCILSAKTGSSRRMG
jgi:hypothetical protein